MINEVVEYAINLRKDYSGSIKNILDENDILIISDDTIEDIGAYTIKIRDKEIIVIYSGLEYIEKDFVILHEIYHILNHDIINRCFSKILGTDRFELEANIFALVFLNLEIYLNEDTKISKIINYTNSVIRSNSLN